MTILVLGPLELRSEDGLLLDALSERQRRLVAALMMSPGRSAPADRLVEMIWEGDQQPQNGIGALRTRLTRLRPTLEAAGASVVNDGTRYRIEVDGEVDVDRFQSGVEGARARLDEGDAATAVEELDRVLALWRGRPFEDVADLEWAQAEVQRLDELRSVAVELRYDAMLERGRHDELAGPLRREIDHSPYRDRLRSQLVIALYRSGRQAEALREIANYRRVLVDELGLDLSPELRTLEERVLGHDPDLLPPSHRTQAVRGYRLEAVIGGDGDSLVWRGRQDVLARDVAVKQIRAALADQPEFIRRFEGDAQVIAALEHPHIVPLYDYWREPGAAYLVMRLMRGGSLADRLRAGPIDAPDLAVLIEQTGGALRAAHRAGVLHRALTPANILLDDDGAFYLADVGISSAIDRDDGSHRRDHRLVNPSPEHLRGADVDERTDIYSLGVILFEAATGRHPFADAGSPHAVARATLDEAVPLPSAVIDDLPQWVDEIVARATARNPSDRFVDVDELLAALPSALHVAPTDGAPVIEPTRNPYKALRAFAEADATDFHGRHQLVDRMVEMLGRPGPRGRFLAVVGPSGSGKSSAVRAGLIPALRAGAIPGSAEWFVTTMTPSRRPFEELEAALARVARKDVGPLRNLLGSGPSGIAEAIDQTLPDTESELVLVLDQLEELYTTVHSADETDRFLAGLATAIDDPSSRVRLVATIRADFWDRPMKHPAVAPLLDAAAITMVPLAPDELEQAIVAPARSMGVEFESGLVARILSDVASERGALPLLQYTLTELFDRRDRDRILASAYQELGGLAGALASTAESVHRDLSDADRDATRRLFGRLVTVGVGSERTRRQIVLGELGDDAAARRCVERFGDARLLTFDHDPRTREPTVEIAHEALISAWPRLGAWIEEDADRLRTQRHLAAAATEWQESGRDPDELYRGARLVAATELAEDDRASLNQRESDFVDESIAAAERSERRVRRRTNALRTLLTTTSLLLVVAVVVGVIAVTQRNDARAARGAADAAADVAERRRLAAEALVVNEFDPQMGLLMAVEAYDADPGPETLGLLQQVMNGAGPVLGFLGAADRQYLDVEWRDDVIVAVSLVGMEIYDSESLDLRHDLVLFDDATSELAPADLPQMVAFDVSEGGTLAATAVDAQIFIVDTADGWVESFLQPSDVEALAVEPSGSQIATGDREGTIRLWSAEGELLWEVEAHPPTDDPEFLSLVAQGMAAADVGVRSLVFTPDGESLISSGDGRFAVWDLEGETPRLEWPATFVGVTEQMFGLAPLLSQDMHIVPGDPDVLYVGHGFGLSGFSLATGGTVLDAPLPTDRFDDLIRYIGTGISSDGTPVVGLTDGRFRVLDADGSPVNTVELPPVGSPGGMAVSPNGTTAIRAGAGGLTLAALDGSRLLARAIPSDPQFDFMGVNTTGDLVSQTVNAFGPTEAFTHGDAGFEPVDLVDDVASRSADLQTVPGGTDVFVTFMFTEESVIWELRPEPAGAETLVSGENLAVAWAYSPDGRYHVGHRFSADEPFNAEVVVWDLDSGEEVEVLTDFGGIDEFLFPRSATFSPDGSTLLVTTDSGHHIVWDTDTWTRRTDLDLGSVVVADYSTDGRYLATVDGDGTIDLRDPSTGEAIRQLVGASPPVPYGGGLAWSADGSTVVSRFENAGRLWDVASGEMIGRAFPNDPLVIPGAADGESPQLVTRVDDTAWVWNLDIDTWRNVACRAAGRDFTADEWERYGPAGEPYRPTCGGQG